SFRETPFRRPRKRPRFLSSVRWGNGFPGCAFPNSRLGTRDGGTMYVPKLCLGMRPARGGEMEIRPAISYIMSGRHRAGPLFSCTFLSQRSLTMRETWTFHSAGQLLFGRNASRQLGEVASRLGARRVLIVTDPILTKTGLVERVRAPLVESGVTVEVF